MLWLADEKHDSVLQARREIRHRLVCYTPYGEYHYGVMATPWRLMGL